MTFIDLKNNENSKRFYATEMGYVGLLWASYGGTGDSRHESKSQLKRCELPNGMHEKLIDIDLILTEAKR